MIKQLKELFNASFNLTGYHNLEIIFVNYYWVLVFGAVLNIFLNINWFDSTFYPLLIYVVLVLERRKIRFNFFDFLWFLYLLNVLFTWLVNSYPFKTMLIIRCVSEQLAYSMCYLIIRKNAKLSARRIIECAFLPLLITSIIGIYCFLVQPSWYMSMTKEGITDFEVLEFLRLRSIFADSYTISYFLGISIIFLLFQLVNGVDNQRKKIYSTLLIVFSITLFMTITRSVIGAVVFALVIAVIYTLRFKKFTNIKPIVIASLIGVSGSIIYLNTLDGYVSEFFTSKISSVTEGTSENIMHRFFLNKKGTSYDIVGDGVGRHNMYADQYVPHSSLRDGEYNKMIIEQGYAGFGVFVLIMLTAIIKCLKNFKYLAFDLSILFFLLICMVAANPISTFDKHPIIYWLILGGIANFNNTTVSHKLKYINA